jgi:hypothetical protein
MTTMTMDGLTPINSTRPELLHRPISNVVRSGPRSVCLLPVKAVRPRSTFVYCEVRAPSWIRLVIARSTAGTRIPVDMHSLHAFDYGGPKIIARVSSDSAPDH